MAKKSGKRISKIEYIGERPVYDLVIHSHSHNFILKNGIVSHNSGKSYSALWLAKTLDPTFTVDRVAFTFKEFMDIITNKDIKGGNVVIWDESGVDLDSRMFFSHLNILANRILQTFRKDNLGVIFTVPDATFVDKRSRTLFHSIIETKSIRTSDNKVKVKWFEVHRSVQSKKEAYLWHPRCIVGGKHYKIGSVFIPKPSRELITPYEKKKNSFTDDLKSDVKAELSDAKTTTKKKKTRSELKAIMKKVVKGEVSNYAKVRNGSYVFSHDVLRFKFSLSLSDAKKLKYMLEEFMNK